MSSKTDEGAMNLKVVIPAAGLGTRLMPLTLNCPKELLPVDAVPMMAYILYECVTNGFTTFIIIDSEHKPQLREYVRSNRWRHDLSLLTGNPHVCKEVSIDFARQGSSKGLGAAVLSSEHLIPDDFFAVVLPDVLMDQANRDLSELFRIHAVTQAAVILATQVATSEVSRYGILECKEQNDELLKLQKVLEKPDPSQTESRLGILGRYILPRTIFNSLKKIQPDRNGEIQLSDAIGLLQDGYVVISRRGHFDCGSLDGYHQACQQMSRQDERSLSVQAKKEHEQVECKSL